MTEYTRDEGSTGEAKMSVYGVDASKYLEAVARLRRCCQGVSR